MKASVNSAKFAAIGGPETWRANFEQGESYRKTGGGPNSLLLQ